MNLKSKLGAAIAKVRTGPKHPTSRFLGLDFAKRYPGLMSAGVVLLTACLLVPVLVRGADGTPGTLYEVGKESIAIVTNALADHYVLVGHLLLIIAASLHAYLVYLETRADKSHRKIRVSLIRLWASLAFVTAAGVMVHLSGLHPVSGELIA